jgi:DNA polymerase-3 subunit gamma/tau
MEKIQEKLAEAARELRVDVDADALMWIAKEGRGSLRDAYTLFDQVLAFSDGHITLGKIREKLGLVGLDRLNTLCEALADARLQQVLDICEEIIAGGVSVDQFILDLGEYFRNLLFLQAGVQRESVIGYRVKEFSSLALESWTEHQLLHAIDELLEVYRRLRFTMNERFELELVLGKLCRLKDYIDQGEMLNRIHDLRRQVEQGSFVYSKKAEISEQKTETQAALVDDVPAQPMVTAADKIRQEGSVAQKQADTKELGSEVANSSGCGTEEASLRNLELSDFERLIEKVNTQSMSLGSALAGAISHTFDDSNVYVTFSAAFAAETVEQGAAVIENCIHTVLGVPLKLQVVCTMAGEETSEEAHPDPQVEMSRKIFRGKIVSG